MAETEIPQDVVALAEKVRFSFVGKWLDGRLTSEEYDALAAAFADAIMADRASRAPDRDALSSAQPEIKGLEWYTNADNGDTLAKSICGTYVVSFCIDDESGEWLTAISPQGDNLGDFATTDLDPAKAVCQSHLAATIRTALAPSVAEPAPGQTYYSEGKDADWFDALDDAEFAKRASYAAMDIADGDFSNVENCLPICAILSGAAERIRRLIAPSPHKGEPVCWRYRYNRMGDGQPWHFSLTDPGELQDGYVKEALYAFPPPVVEGMVLVRRKLTPEMDTLLVRAGSLNTIYDTQNVWDKLLALAAPNQADGAGE